MDITSGSASTEMLLQTQAIAYDHIRTDLTDGAARLTLDRPPLNILTLAMIRELSSAVEVLGQRTDLRVVTLDATGNAFCAGVDVADHTAERVEPMIREFGALFRALHALPALTVAVVHGAALGGGMELALGCDVVLAGASARFGQPEIALGVFPPVAAAILPALTGYQQAARLVLAGETLSAAEAARVGVATVVVPEGELLDAVARVVSRAQGYSASALRLAKRALVLGAERGPARAFTAIEDLYLDDLMTTHDAHEGIAAFMEKRNPVWRHW